MAHTGNESKINWRKIFFYAAEITFAVIGGIGESYIYYAYLPPGPWRVAEAIARAVITQIAIVLFGVAAVEAVHASRGFWRKFFAAMPANIATLVASLVAFWFMRDAAIIFRDTAFLAPAEQTTFTLPNGYTLQGQTIDIYLIAALPFFQVGLNWLAPIIVQDRAPETAEERAIRQQRELDEAQHKARLEAAKGKVRAAQAASLRAQGAALLGRAKGSSINEEDGATTTANSGEGDGVSSQGNGVDASGQSTGISTNNTPGSGQAGSGGKGIRAVPAGRWIWRDLIADMQARYGIVLTEREARDAMKTMLPPNKRERLDGVPGKPYAAHKATVKAWVDSEATRRLRNGDMTSIPTHHASA